MRRFVLRYNCIAIATLALVLIAAITHAEEGGSGHYMPGSMAFFVDGVSSNPTFIARLANRLAILTAFFPEGGIQ
jgi:hypothetical protein